MRGQVQASVARLGNAPVRERLVVWADARVRKRAAARVREVALMVAVGEEERRHMVRIPWGRANIALRRLPY